MSWADMPYKNLFIMGTVGYVLIEGLYMTAITVVRSFEVIADLNRSVNSLARVIPVAH